ncbi:MAG: hypothetical protein QOF51_1134 [Chloroflexota bacterium]|jgi:PAS domain S-box-containing protein|nr:hypothetical protein [Chloroflexota bacterium]
MSAVHGRVLLVDDEQALIAAASTGLIRAGYQVRATTDPHQAIDFAIHEPVDLLISDIMMPGLSGIELLRTIKQVYPDAAGIMITGHGTMDLAIAALQAGASGFLLKPFTTNELRLAAEDALAKSRVLKENLRLKALLPLYEASRLFHAERDPAQLAAVVCAQLAHALQALHVTLFRANRIGGDELWTFHGEAEDCSPLQAEATRSQLLPLDTLRWVAQTGEPLVVPIADNTPTTTAGPEVPGATLYLPLLANGTVVGVICARRDGNGAGFEDAEVETAAILASHAALALHNAATAHENARLYEESQRHAQDLAASEERFRRLAENAEDAIYYFEVRPAPRFTYVSPAAVRMLGVQAEQYYANPDLMFSLTHPDDLPKLHAEYETMLTGQAPTEPLLLRRRHVDGHYVWNEQRSVPLYDDQGELFAIEGISRDVTERKQLEEHISRAQRLETAGQVAAQVAHDFNNLLVPLVGFPELIKLQLPADHPAVAYCDAMLDAAQRISEINEDLLVLGRRGHFEARPVDLSALVHEAVRNQVAEERRPYVDVDLHASLLVRGAPSQLMRVIMNLLVNALDASPEHGRIQIRTEDVSLNQPLTHHNRIESGEYVRLDICDRGSGIPPELREHIFDPFFTTKSAGGRSGTGLGLSVVQSVVNDHHGYVDYRSDVGGTTFSVYLPVDRQPAAPALAEVQGGEESLLVVDDDPTQRKLVGTLLSSLGYTVAEAASGEAALNLCRQHPYDLVILDMIMPDGMDGTETFRRLRELEPGQRAILLSGYAESERVVTANSLGVGRCLRKPATRDQLARAVRGELDRKSSVLVA